MEVVFALVIYIKSGYGGGPMDSGKRFNERAECQQAANHLSHIQWGDSWGTKDVIYICAALLKTTTPEQDIDKE